MKFIVIDDSETMRKFAVNTLTSIGHEVVAEASNGKLALTILQSGKKEIDFAFIDWNMPIMDGIELTRAIRNDPKLKNLPIIMVTSRGTKYDLLKAVQAKVNSYLVKPYTAEVLKEKIDSVLIASSKLKVNLRIVVDYIKNFSHVNLNYVIKNKDGVSETKQQKLTFHEDNQSEPVVITKLNPSTDTLTIELQLEELEIKKTQENVVKTTGINEKG